jgi:YbbR domain-containing protein
LTREKLLLKITEKWHIKTLSVAAALLIFVFYRMNSLETRSLTVPLIIKTSENLIPVNSFPKAVRISLKGEAPSINLILEEELEAYIDLTRYSKEGLFRAPVQILKSGSALGIDPLEISVFPAEIQSMLELKEIRGIPVYPVFGGTVAHGFEMTDQSITPTFVTAEGPHSILNSQYEFATNTIELDGRNENFSLLVNIINDNPLITIHGNKMIEYSAVIRPIHIQSEFNEYEEYDIMIPENVDNQE